MRTGSLISKDSSVSKVILMQIDTAFIPRVLLLLNQNTQESSLQDTTSALSNPRTILTKKIQNFDVDFCE